VHISTGTVSGTTALDNGRYALSNLRIGGPYAISIRYLGYA